MHKYQFEYLNHDRQTCRLAVTCASEYEARMAVARMPGFDAVIRCDLPGPEKFVLEPSHG